MNRNSTLSYLGLAAALTITPACTKTKSAEAPQSCPIPIKTPTPTESEKLPLDYQPKLPRNEAEFYSNLLSCEANLNSHKGYMEAILKRLSTETVDITSLPCVIVHDIHTQFTTIIEVCSAVQAPNGLTFEQLSPTQIAERQKLIYEANSAARDALKLRKKVETSTPRCFESKAASPKTFSI